MTDLTMSQFASKDDLLAAQAARIAELETQHREELRAYEITVANREARIAELEDDLQFVERWAVHHGSKPSISAEEALSCIQHYPAIHEITKSYKDGKRPDTFNPYARIAELESQLEAIGAGGVEPLRKQAAAQQAVQAATQPAARGMDEERLRNLLCKMVDQLERRWKHRDGNAPGHGHSIPGVWDSDNGELAGKKCAWCEVWQEALEVHAAAQAKQGGAA